MTAIADAAMGNPWLRDQLGQDVNVKIERSKDGDTIRFVFTRVSEH
jgi:hypothetical protein